MVGRLEVLRGQFDLTWALAQHHLARVSTASLLWEPVPSCWTVRADATGFWRPDWEVPEPDPVPPPTAAWITWHWGWWWTVATAHLEGGTPPDREDVGWPGDAAGTAAWLAGLHARWVTLLGRLDEPALDAPAAFPWPSEAGRTTADLLAWANVEMMKNVAELGQLTMLHAAARRGPAGHLGDGA